MNARTARLIRKVAKKRIYIPSQYRRMKKAWQSLSAKERRQKRQEYERELRNGS